MSRRLFGEQAPCNIAFVAGYIGAHGQVPRLLRGMHRGVPRGTLGGAHPYGRGIPERGARVRDCWSELDPGDCEPCEEIPKLSEVEADGLPKEGAVMNAEVDKEVESEDKGEAKASSDQKLTTLRKRKAARIVPKRRNARCTVCNKEHNRWPGTMCVDCVKSWCETGEPASAKCCLHCGTADTCRWMRGPQGLQTLCNACRKRFYVNGTVEYTRRKVDGRVAKQACTAQMRSTSGNSSSRTTPSCTNCGVKETRMRQSGPAVRRTLCDDCGIRWKRKEGPIPPQEVLDMAEAVKDDVGMYQVLQ